MTARPRLKRLHRVEARDADGVVTFRRDYQGREAAEERADRLLEGVNEPPIGEGDGYYRAPAATVTIQTSEPVVFTADPEPHRRPPRRSEP